MQIKHLFIVATLFSALSCSSGKKSNATSLSKSTGDGLSFSTAIVIMERSETKGTSAEYTWIRNHYSNYTIKGQSLTMNEKIRYDIITIIQSDGKELPLYFDISNFYGKF